MWVASLSLKSKLKLVNFKLKLMNFEPKLVILHIHRKMKNYPCPFNGSKMLERQHGETEKIQKQKTRNCNPAWLDMGPARLHRMLITSITSVSENNKCIKCYANLKHNYVRRI